MTPERIRIVIAEECGRRMFVIHKPIRDPFGYYRENGNGYTTLENAWQVTEEVGRRHIGGKPTDFDRVVLEPAPIPNYPFDLNACHEMEKILNEKQQVWYLQKLTQVRFKEGVAGMIACMNDKTTFATAMQRCEAFLRTIGKWEE